MASENPKRILALTQGDAAGIGPEIIVKAYATQPSLMHGTFVAGDLNTLRRAAACIASAGHPQLPVWQIEAPQQAQHVPSACIPVFQVGEAMQPVEFGAVSAVAGEFAGRCVRWAANAAMRGEIAAMVTAPLHKEALSAAGEPYSRFPGHTEMLQGAAAAYARKNVTEMPVRMMLANDELRTVLVSIHMSLRAAIEAVTLDNVLQTILITHASLFRLLGRPPRIAVAGLNPHAGEGGLFGHEEIDAIVPAVAAARAQGCNVSGPCAPDTVFMRARGKPGCKPEFDVVVAMYHDQGLIPVKYLGVERGVNVTLGLPLVRTSPDHGTAFDIAGTGRADASSLIEAVRMARSMSNFRPGRPQGTRTAPKPI
jgi:4-hydroxythreonine-4-phosphate dehydrogenase